MVRKLCHNRWLAATTVVAVALVPVAAPLARDHGPPPVHAEARPDYAIAKKRLDTLFDGLPKLRMSFDTRDIDVGARARALGPDVDASFAFVRDRIAYQRYRGTLRFALGTLMSRAGNSCDQAALLGALLRRHHRRVRYAVGVLDTATARRLVGMTDQPRVAASRDKLYQRPSRERIAALAGLGFSKDRIAAIAARDRKAAAAVFRYIGGAKAFHAARIEDHLKSAGMSPKAVGFDASPIVAAARRHCWVQVEREGKWVDLDPSFRNAKPGQHFTDAKSTADALPASLAYRLTFTLRIEQRTGKKVKTHVVLRRTALLRGGITSISLRFVPEKAKRGGPLDRTKIGGLLKFKVAWPVLVVDGKPQAGAPFDLKGNKLSRDIRKRTMGGIAKALGSIGFGKKPAKSALGRVVLEMRLAGPGGERWRVERVIAARRGAKTKRAALNLRLQLLGGYHVMATGSRVRSALVRRAMLARAVARRKVYETALDLAYGRIKVTDVLGRAKAKPERRSVMLLRYFATRSALMDAALKFGFPNLVAYPAEPQVAAIRSGIRMAVSRNKTSTVQVHGVDVIANRIRILARPGATANDAWRAATFAIEQGVLDTLTEYVLLADPNAINAVPVLKAATDKKIGLAVLKPSASARQLDPFPATVRPYLRRELKGGYWVIAPKGAVPLGRRKVFAWWRIDPKTGETLGIGPTGEGQGYSERAGTQRIAISTTTPAADFRTEMCVGYVTVATLVFADIEHKPYKTYAKAAAATALCMAGAGAWRQYSMGAPLHSVALGAINGIGNAAEIAIGGAAIAGTFVAIDTGLKGFIAGATDYLHGGHAHPANDPYGWCNDLQDPGCGPKAK